MEHFNVKSWELNVVSRTFPNCKDTGGNEARPTFNNIKIMPCNIIEYVLCNSIICGSFLGLQRFLHGHTHSSVLLSDSVCRTIANSGTHPPSSEIKQDASIPLFLLPVRRAAPASAPLYLPPQPPRRGDGLCLLTNASLVTDNRNM